MDWKCGNQHGNRNGLEVFRFEDSKVHWGKGDYVDQVAMFFRSGGQKRGRRISRVGEGKQELS